MGEKKKVANGKIPLFTGDILANRPYRLGAQEEATFEELGKLDPHLAGLYRLGHELADRIDEPGVSYLIAHAGRELNRGVVEHLGGNEGEAQTNTTDEVQENESNRQTIGSILGLPPDHASVTTWFKLNGLFSRMCHYRSSAPDRQRIKDAFLQLSELIYGRIAPFFDTHQELKKFIKIPAPTEKDIERVQSLLVRPQQREFFFSNLKNSNWLSLLREKGHFDRPPDRIGFTDGSWRSRPWPEGNYLVHIAHQMPEEVTVILSEIPPTNKNPTVWHSVIDAAKVLPGEKGGRLAKILAEAIKNEAPLFFSHDVIDLIKILAERGEDAAFLLAKPLLWLQKPPEIGDSSINAQRIRYDTSWLLQRLEIYDLQEFSEKAIPALEKLSALDTIKLLANRLNRAVRLVEENSGDRSLFDNSSRWWCENVNLKTREDVRAIFASDLTAVSKRLAERSPADAQKVWDCLHEYDSEIYQRIRFAILAHAGQNLPIELDRTIGNDSILSLPFPAREVAPLLRQQFVNASSGARMLFQHALERGPSTQEIWDTVAGRRESQRRGEKEKQFPGEPPAPEEIQEEITRWQQTRLRWFHDRISADLQPIAKRLGVRPKVPSARQQALDEVGYYIQSSAGSGERSPKSAEEMAEMDLSEVIAFLNAWKPNSIGPDKYSRRGLELALTAYAKQLPDRASKLVMKGIDASLEPGYLSAILRGLKESLESKADISWPDLLELALSALQYSEKCCNYLQKNETENAFRGKKVSEDDFRNVIKVVSDLVKMGCNLDAIPEKLSDSVWGVAKRLVFSPVTWSEGKEIGDAKSFGDVLSASLNTLGGNSTEALIAVALWNYRRLARDEKSNGHVEKTFPELEDRSAPLYKHILSHGGRSGQGAKAMLGNFLPHLYMLAPGWAKDSEEMMLTHGMQDPINHPIWAAYVTRSKLYDTTFRQLRFWYVRALDWSACKGQANGNSQPEDSEFSIKKGIAHHVLDAVIRGLAAVGDQDSLVEKTFLNVPAEHLSRVYWGVFRGWTDSSQPATENYAKRIIDLWEWRLSELERKEKSPEGEKEAEGLVWFIKTPYLPAEDVISLGLRTVLLNKEEQKTSRLIWERLCELAEFDAAGVFEIVKHLINQELRADHTYLRYEKIAPALKAAIECGDPAVKDQATRLIHKLGEAGYLEFGLLLSSEE